MWHGNAVRPGRSGRPRRGGVAVAASRRARPVPHCSSAGGSAQCERSRSTGRDARWRTGRAQARRPGSQLCPRLEARRRGRGADRRLAAGGPRAPHAAPDSHTRIALPVGDGRDGDPLRGCLRGRGARVRVLTHLPGARAPRANSPRRRRARLARRLPSTQRSRIVTRTSPRAVAAPRLVRVDLASGRSTSIGRIPPSVTSLRLSPDAGYLAGIAFSDAVSGSPPSRAILRRPRTPAGARSDVGLWVGERQRRRRLVAERALSPCSSPGRRTTCASSIGSSRCASASPAGRAWRRGRRVDGVRGSLGRPTAGCVAPERSRAGRTTPPRPVGTGAPRVADQR